jgi:hypothetical protein
MKNIFLSFFMIITTMTWHLEAQPTLSTNSAEIEMHLSLGSSFPRGGQAAYAPLFLYTNGMGAVYPYKGGDLLQVGRSYGLVAIPMNGYTFAYWTRVNVFTITQTNFDADGIPTDVIHSTVVSSTAPVSTYPELRFTMQPEEVIALGNPTITRSIGYEANFVHRRRSFPLNRSGPRP